MGWSPPHPIIAHLRHTSDVGQRPFTSRSEELFMNMVRVGVDIAKSVFHVHGVDRHDQVQWRGKYSRINWLDAIIKRVPVGAEIGMEACASSHYWARVLKKLGCSVKLIAAQFVKPYVKSNKNDRVDAEAICEAISTQYAVC